MGHTQSLSDREIEIIQLVANGLMNQEIGDKLEISKRTVDNHISNILRQTECSNRVMLVIWALQTGTISLSRLIFSELALHHSNA